MTDIECEICHQFTTNDVGHEVWCRKFRAIDIPENAPFSEAKAPQTIQPTETVEATEDLKRRLKQNISIGIVLGEGKGPDGNSFS